MTTAGFPHSDTLGSQPGCRLPEDYRRLQRPSSAPGTKTSTVCPYKLDTRHYMQFSAENRRCSRPLCSSQDTDGTMPQGPPSGRPVRRPFESAPSKAAASSGPNSVLDPPGDHAPSFRSPARGSVLTGRLHAQADRIASAPLESMDAQVNVCHLRAPVLLRKEVIQPHLPVRLPCYDFVPIADPTFDSSLPYGLGRRLRVLPTFVT